MTILIHSAAALLRLAKRTGARPVGINLDPCQLAPLMKVSMRSGEVVALPMLVA